MVKTAPDQVTLSMAVNVPVGRGFRFVEGHAQTSDLLVPRIEAE